MTPKQYTIIQLMLERHLAPHEREAISSLVESFIQLTEDYKILAGMSNLVETKFQERLSILERRVKILDGLVVTKIDLETTYNIGSIQERLARLESQLAGNS